MILSFAAMVPLGPFTEPAHVVANVKREKDGYVITIKQVAVRSLDVFRILPDWVADDLIDESVRLYQMRRAA